MIKADGEPIDVLSANSRANPEADKAAFAALMRHLKALDGDEHTILLVQIENEAGGIGSVRDFLQQRTRCLLAKFPPTCWPSSTSVASERTSGPACHILGDEIGRRSRGTWFGKGNTQSVATEIVASDCAKVLGIKNTPHRRARTLLIRKDNFMVPSKASAIRPDEGWTVIPIITHGFAAGHGTRLRNRAISRE